MKIIDAIYLDQPRTAIDLVVRYNLDEMAERVGLEPMGQPDDIAKMMSHRTYMRVGRRVRKREGKIIA